MYQKYWQAPERIFDPWQSELHHLHTEANYRFENFYYLKYIPASYT